MNFFKTIIVSIKHWATEQISDLETKMNKALEQKQPIGDYVTKDDIPEPFSCSWNDLTNKPFGYEGTYVVCMEEREIPSSNRMVYGEDFLYAPAFEVGEKYRITIDGVSYETKVSDNYNYIIGNPIVQDERNNGDTGEPFAVSISEYPGGYCYYFYFADDAESHTVKFEHFKGILNTIDETFIPDTIARTKDIPIVTEHFSGDWHDLTNKPFVDEIRKVIESNSGYEWDSESRAGHLFATIPITRYYDLIDGKEYTINIGSFSAKGIYIASDSSIRVYVDDYYDYEVHFYFPSTDDTVVNVSTDDEFGSHVNDNDPFAIYEADWHTVIKSECLPDDLSCSWNDLADKPFGEVTGWHVCMEEREIPASSPSVFGEDFLYAPDPIVGGKYRITIDGVPYETTYNGATGSKPIIGNPVVENVRNDVDTGEPFAVALAEYPGGYCYNFYFADTTKNHVVKFEHFTTSIVTVDEKFIPDTIARKSDIGGSGGVMFVNFRPEYINPSEYTFIPDKTFTEIATAVESGMYVVAHEPEYAGYLPLTNLIMGDPTYVVFSATRYDWLDKEYKNQSVIIYDNDVVETDNME